MTPLPGPSPADVTDLARAQDRLSFVYLERATIHRDGNALTATDERGIIHIPAATLGALILGPGTRVTHQAMMLVADSGSTVVWVGEHGVRYYAHGRGLTTRSHLIEAQARAFANQTQRLRVARSMYEMRFPDEDVSTLTMQQLRGREGARVRRTYRTESERTGVPWTRRDYRPDDFTASDPVNQALSAATTCLYGITHAVIVALGASPALGFVHTGHARSFVYDIADLYKAQYAIPIAFDIAAQATDNDTAEDIGALTRRRVRDAIHHGRLLDQCARDIRQLLLTDQDQEPDWDVVYLWDGADRTVPAGTDHAWDDPAW